MKIVSLPQEALKDGGIVGPVVEDVGGGQPETFELLLEVRSGHVVLLMSRRLASLQSSTTPASKK
jgi:hypothetical protein